MSDKFYFEFSLPAFITGYPKEDIEIIINKRLENTGISYNFKYIIDDNGKFSDREIDSAILYKMYIELEDEKNYNMFIMNFDDKDSFIELCEDDFFENMVIS